MQPLMQQRALRIIESSMMRFVGPCFLIANFGAWMR